ncbi:MAG TPA: LemA family protein [Blastocatellia bacterium]|nr:LemA family protein [Blastocatellia bacterium]
MSNYEPGAATDQRDQFRQEFSQQQNQMQQQKRSRSRWMTGALIGVLLLFLIVGGGACGTYNSLYGKREGVKQQWSNVDVNLQRRADLIPNLVNTVKGYTKHEEQVFSEIAQARSRLINPQATPEEKIAANAQMDSALSRLLVISEAYPDLKASEQYKDLMTQLEGTENRIGVARRDYNERVADYNISRGRFPGVIFANLFGFQREEEFKADPGKREVPEVKF